MRDLLLHRILVTYNALQLICGRHGLSLASSIRRCSSGGGCLPSLLGKSLEGGSSVSLTSTSVSVNRLFLLSCCSTGTRQTHRSSSPTTSIILDLLSLLRPRELETLLLRTLRRIGIHNAPINAPPPVLQVLPLRLYAVVVHVDMLPRIHAHHGHDLRAPRGNICLLAPGLGVCAEGAGVVLRRHVGGLLPIAGLRVGRAGEIGGEDAPVAVGVGAAGVGGRAGGAGVAGPDEPDEARAEHAGGGVEEGGAEGFDAAEGADEGLFELGHVVEAEGRRGEGGEEVVVVVQGGGVVEEARVHGIPRELGDDVFDFHVLDRLAGDQLAELVGEHGLVLGPGDIEALCGQEAWYAAFGE